MDAPEKYTAQVKSDESQREVFDWKPYRWFMRQVRAYFISGIFFLIFLVVFIANHTEASYLQNIAAAIVGTIFTITVLEVRANKREEENLILQMGSRSNAFAVEASRLLRLKGVLTDGTLQNRNFEGADLSKADLHGADLRGADLGRGDLREANLTWANLSGATLHGTQFHGAYLYESNLNSAKLVYADLSKASLYRADLRNVDLRGVNLSETDLNEATLDKVTLPDGSKWEQGRDLREFTHPEAWKAEQET